MRNYFLVHSIIILISQTFQSHVPGIYKHEHVLIFIMVKNILVDRLNQDLRGCSIIYFNTLIKICNCGKAESVQTITKQITFPYI